MTLIYVLSYHDFLFIHILQLNKFSVDSLGIYIYIIHYTCKIQFMIPQMFYFNYLNIIIFQQMKLLHLIFSCIFYCKNETQQC